MARTKTKDWVPINLSLDAEVAKKLTDLTQTRQISRAEVIEQLINREFNYTDFLLGELKSISKQEEIIKKQADELAIRRATIQTSMEKVESWKKIQQSQKGAVIALLQQIILRNDHERAEIYAKSQQSKLGMRWEELIGEAMEGLAKTGI